jgi:glycosyltransferase involved in cell wall biosynthesis
MRVVVVHRGARDAYQLALAMYDYGLLDRLVTDLYWPADRWWAPRIERAVPAGLRGTLRRRCEFRLPGEAVRLCGVSGAASLFLSKLPFVPFSWQRAATRWADATLGRAAGRLASRTGSALLSYSYYGYSGFSSLRSGLPRILFQLHPHPISVRKILSRELEDHPDCAASLNKEWELCLPEQDFANLAAETTMADAWIAASSFTRQTLVENGIPGDKIHVIPYGTDLRRFTPSSQLVSASGPLRLLFVGTINQRKGIKYLLEALRMLPTSKVQLSVCGRVVDDLRLFEPFATQVRLRPSVSDVELLEAYRSSDLLVFPSVAEGFGHVILEAMACGLPVLSTTHTAAPDLITNGEDGFVVEPRNAEQLARNIEWALGHRIDLRRMGRAARAKAEQFTWARFRRGVGRAVENCIEAREHCREVAAHHV